LTEQDGSKYSGEWKAGKKNGQGAVVKDGIAIKVGVWLADVYIGAK